MGLGGADLRDCFLASGTGFAGSDWRFLASFSYRSVSKLTRHINKDKLGQHLRSDRVT